MMQRSRLIRTIDLDGTTAKVDCGIQRCDVNLTLVGSCDVESSQPRVASGYLRSCGTPLHGVGYKDLPQ